MTQTAEISTELLCHQCGYDLRAHPQEGRCPECCASVAEARRWAAIPRRPAWRNSDPRWRRRMLAGVWLLVLIPLWDVIKASGWASKITMPTVVDYRGDLTLDETLLSTMYLYESVLFCIGIVMLFSKERARRPGPLDWTRRWGVICSYVVFLLSAAQVLFIAALVSVGVTALFLSMPLQFQPKVTPLLATLSTSYLLYGAYPHDIATVVIFVFSSVAILLACISLFDALRSSGPKRLAAIFVAPLALFALVHLAQAGWYVLGYSYVTLANFFPLGVYFSSDTLVRGEVLSTFGIVPTGSALTSFTVEAIKWFAIFAIAIWLSIAQFRARRS